MEILDWVAILGALAWTPHVISMIRNAITKPEIRVISSRNAEIGFTTLGPIFNVRLAFSVKNHDIAVSGLKIRIIHESGEGKLFEWQFIKQQVFKMTTPDGTVMPYEKENSVLAIKLNQKEIEERTIQCQETAFINEKTEYESKALKKLVYLKDQPSFNNDDFLGSQEMVDLYNYIKRSFSWKAGNYEVVVELESPDDFELVDHKFTFSLTPLDIEELEKNKGQIEVEYGKKAEAGDDQEIKAAWNWRNPILRKA